MSKSITIEQTNNSIRMEYTKGTSNKFYSLVYTKNIENNTATYEVTAMWGRIGGISTNRSRYKGASFRIAQTTWDNIIYLKLKKGYVEVKDTSSTAEKVFPQKSTKKVNERISTKAQKLKEEERLKKIRAELEQDRFGDLEI